MVIWDKEAYQAPFPIFWLCPDVSVDRAKDDEINVENVLMYRDVS